MRATTSIAASLLLLPCLAAVARAESPAPSPADHAFIASLANPQAVLKGAGMPGPRLNSCSVTQDCDDGTSVSCTGNSTCQTTFAGVKCDGVETRCPNFCSIAMSCQCCNGPYTTFCWSRSGDCQYTGGGIECNGNEITCEQSCPLCPEW